MIKGLPFELRPVSFDDSVGRQALLRLNPTGQMPTVEDGTFVIYEMPAILTYLCEKEGWSDLLPSDLRARAFVNQYLHFHHNWTRRLTKELMGPHVAVAMLDRIRGRDHLSDLVERASAPDKLTRGRKTVQHVAGLIEAGYFRDGERYLCTSRPTIADIACYEEVAQLRWANLFDFGDFPKIDLWLGEMEKLPFHEQVHRYNTVLGDIRSQAPTGERLLKAIEAGFAGLAEQT
jgi:glutathione S-transferase